MIERGRRVKRKERGMKEVRKRGRKGRKKVRERKVKVKSVEEGLKQDLETF